MTVLVMSDFIAGTNDGLLPRSGRTEGPPLRSQSDSNRRVLRYNFLFAMPKVRNRLIAARYASALASRISVLSPRPRTFEPL